MTQMVVSYFKVHEIFSDETIAPCAWSPSYIPHVPSETRSCKIRLSHNLGFINYKLILILTPKLLLPSPEADIYQVLKRMWSCRDPICHNKIFSYIRGSPAELCYSYGSRLDSDNVLQNMISRCFHNIHNLNLELWL